MVARSADLEMAPTVLKRVPIGHWKRPRRALRWSRGWPHHQGSRVTRRRSVTVDARPWAARGPHLNPPLGADARGRDGGTGGAQEGYRRRARRL
jgi:hypothetical protein